MSEILAKKYKEKIDDEDMPFAKQMIKLQKTLLNLENNRYNKTPEMYISNTMDDMVNIFNDYISSQPQIPDMCNNIIESDHEDDNA